MFGSELMGKIATGLITATATLLVCLINNYFQGKRDEKLRENNLNSIISKYDESFHMIEYKIEELTKHVEKHNNVIERMYSLEKKTDIQEEQIKVANHRIEDLERKG